MLVLYLSVVDVDNYTPSFSLPTYVFSMVYYDPVGTTLAPAGIITATDQDTGTNGIFGFYLDQTGLPSDYFQVRSIKSELFSNIPFPYIELKTMRVRPYVRLHLQTE